MTALSMSMITEDDRRLGGVWRAMGLSFHSYWPLLLTCLHKGWGGIQRFLNSYTGACTMSNHLPNLTMSARCISNSWSQRLDYGGFGLDRLLGEKQGSSCGLCVTGGWRPSGREPSGQDWLSLNRRSSPKLSKEHNCINLWINTTHTRR